MVKLHLHIIIILKSTGVPGWMIQLCNDDVMWTWLGTIMTYLWNVLTFVEINCLKRVRFLHSVCITSFQEVPYVLHLQCYYYYYSRHSRGVGIGVGLDRLLLLFFFPLIIPQFSTILPIILCGNEIIIFFYNPLFSTQYIAGQPSTKVWHI